MTTMDDRELQGIGYEPLASAWICPDHGMPDCRQHACADLPWEVTKDPKWHPFIDWAHRQFDQIMAAVEPDDDTPDDAFNAYWPSDYMQATTAS